MRFTSNRQRSKWGTTENTRNLIYRGNPRKSVLGIGHSHSNKEVTRIRDPRIVVLGMSLVQDISQHK